MSGRDIGASVRQRLLNKSRTQGRPFQELLQYFAMERFLYRLAKSPYSDRFVLKGALLLTAWRAPQSRPTMDIDLEGRVNNRLDHIKEVVATVCEVDVDPDSIAFNRTSIEASRIKEDADYEGVRVQFHATLARARIPMQLDIGFGDVITPEPTDIEYPSLLDFPAPVLRAYPKETVVAEKLEALTALGLLNSRMKDFYDLALLSRMYPFQGERLVKAISARLLYLCSQPQRPGIRLDFAGSQADLGNEQLRNSRERTHWLPQTLVLKFKPARGGEEREVGPPSCFVANEFQTSARLLVRLSRLSKRAGFRIKVISEVTWIKAASKGPSSPKAARPMPSASTATVPTKFCQMVRRTDKCSMHTSRFSCAVQSVQM